jgi:hypothetical protein
MDRSLVMKWWLAAALLLSGCATAPVPQDGPAKIPGSDLLEVVSITGGGKQQLAVMSRADIAVALGSEPAQWRHIILSRENLIDA